MKKTDPYGFNTDWMSHSAQRKVYRHFAAKSVLSRNGEEYVLSHTATDARFRSRLIKSILNHLCLTDRVLSVAEGGGHLMRALIRKGLVNIQGVDICAELVEAGKKQGLDIREAPAEKLPFAGGIFDALIINESIGAVGLTKALREARRVLKMSGRIIISSYNYAEHNGKAVPSSLVKYRYISTPVILDALRLNRFADITVDSVLITGKDRMDIITGTKRR